MCPENKCTSTIVLEKGIFWSKCDCSVNTAFVGFRFDPTTWTNPDMRLHGEALQSVTTTYSERYALPFGLNPKTRIHFNSNPMGAGKTEQIKLMVGHILKGERPENYTDEMIEALRQFIRETGATRICFLGPRVTFDEQLQMRLERFGVQLYLDLEPTDDPDLVIYQFESCHKIRGKASYDILVIDEVEAVLSQVTAGLNKSHIKDNTSAFAMLVKSADLVLCLDAFLSKKSIDTFTDILSDDPTFCFREHVTIHKNAFREHMARKYFLHKSRASILNQLANSIAKGNRVAVVVGTYKQGEYIVKHICSKFPNLRHRFYHREDPGKNRYCPHLDDFKGDLNDIWPELDVVIYTSKLTVGADFSKKGHFKELFMFLDNDQVVIHDYAQMGGRGRDIPVVHAYVQQPFSGEVSELTLDAIKHRLQCKQQTVIDREHNFLSGNYHLSDAKRFEWRYTEDWLFTLTAYNKLEQNLTKGRMLQYFLWYIKEQGGSFCFVDREHTPPPETKHDWSRDADPSPEVALQRAQDELRATADEERQLAKREAGIEERIVALSPTEREERLLEIEKMTAKTDDDWKEQSLLKLGIVYPAITIPTFKAMKDVRARVPQISTVALFLKKDLHALRTYEHIEGPLDALSQADAFVFSRMSFVFDLLKRIGLEAPWFNADVHTTLLEEKAVELTALLKTAHNLFNVRLQDGTRKVLGVNPRGTLTSTQTAGLLQQIFKQFMFCDFKSTKRVTRYGVKLAVYQLLPQSVGGVPIDELARSSKFGSGKRKRQLSGPSEPSSNGKRAKRGTQS